MRPELFIFLYGVGAILGIPSAVFWGTMAARRAREITHQWRHDRYLVLATAFTCISVGISIAYVVRVFVGLTFGFSVAIIDGFEGVVLILGLSFLMVGFLLMVLLADLEVHPPKWRWTKYALAVTALWAVIVALLSFDGWGGGP